MQTQSTLCRGNGDKRLQIWGRCYVVASLVHLALPDFVQGAWWGPAICIISGCILLWFRHLRSGFLLNLAAHLWTLLFLRDVLTQSTLLLIFSWLGFFGCIRKHSDVFSKLVWISGLTYVVAAVHKLNSTFFDLEYSCAVHGLEKVMAHWSITLPDFYVEMSPILTIVLELSIGLSLLCRHRSFWLLAALFHIPLVVTLAPAFGAVMLCGASASIDARGLVRVRRFFRKYKWVLFGSSITVMLIQASVAQNELSWIQHFQVAGYFAVGWLGFATKGSGASPLLDGGLSGLVWLLFCLTPYVGIQYQHTGAMLSNLRIDPNCHNSYLFSPKLISVDPYIRINTANFGTDQWAKRKRILEAGLWNGAALFTMRRNWCVDWVRPIQLELKYLDRSYRIPDLCEDRALDFLPPLDRYLSGLQRFQKNLKRRCEQHCIH